MNNIKTMNEWERNEADFQSFYDILTLLRALKLFVNKVNYYQSGNIIGICRDQNGFIDYIRDGLHYLQFKQ